MVTGGAVTKFLRFTDQLINEYLKQMAARIAIIAITVSSSISVNAAHLPAGNPA